MSENTFAFRLLGALAGDAPTKNVFFSPASVTLALGMALAGARGPTRDELVTLLGLGDGPLDQLAALGAVLDHIAQDEGATLTSANALWASQQFPPDPGYVQRCRELFGAHVESLDFADPGAVAVINAWVSDHTAGKIPDLLASLDAAVMLVLTNAIFFKGTWQQQFDPARTRPGAFHGPAGVRDVPMMALRAELPYTETRDYQAVSLPYGEHGGRLCMDVVVPREGVGVGRVMAGLDAAGWAALARRLAPREGRLELPRFHIEYAQELTPALERLGVRHATRPGQADFGGISERRPAISAVIHRAVLEVNEEGAEAAAATAVVMTLGAMLPAEQPFHLRADRPFLLAIRDRHTGVILFLGAIIDLQ